LYEYQNKGLTKFAFCKRLILKGAILVVWDCQQPKLLPEKRKAGPFGSAQDKQAPALQAWLSTGLGVLQNMEKSRKKMASMAGGVEMLAP
jgi:hypothetical protein